MEQKQWLLKDTVILKEKGNALLINEIEGGLNIETLCTSGKIHFAFDKVDVEYILRLVKDNVESQRAIFNDSTDKNVIENFLSYEKKIIETLEVGLAAHKEEEEENN